MSPLIGRTLLSGTIASLAMAAALGAMARREGKSAIRSINATSHWYHGAKAGRARRADLPHTAVGFATHYGASLFWAALFEALRRRIPGRAPFRAAAVSALAAVVDYGLVPKRLTPGWERVLPPEAIALAYFAMALALGATRVEPENKRRAGSEGAP